MEADSLQLPNRHRPETRSAMPPALGDTDLERFTDEREVVTGEPVWSWPPQSPAPADDGQSGCTAEA